jgi:hypothetical protein
VRYGISTTLDRTLRKRNCFGGNSSRTSITRLYKFLEISLYFLGLLVGEK